MTSILSDIASTFQLSSLHQLSELILSYYDIPADSKRLAYPASIPSAQAFSR